MQGRQRAVSEAEETNIKLTLVALNALALHVHFALRGDDGLDIIGFGQGTHIHIVVHHQELVFKVRTAEPVALHLLDAGDICCRPAVSAWYTNAIFAPPPCRLYEHFLPWWQVRQLVPRAGTSSGCSSRTGIAASVWRGRVRVVGDGQAVVAVALICGEAAVHEIRSVGNVDAVRPNRAGEYACSDAGKEIHHNFGQSGGQNSGDFLQNEIADRPRPQSARPR